MRGFCFEGFMASATVLIMQQTQAQVPPDLPPISDQKIPLHQDKIRDNDSAAAAGSFNRLLPSPSPSAPGGGRYTTRSKNIKKGIKKQPQRGLGVAQLEKLRLQDESRQEQPVSCLAYAHTTIPLERTCSGSFLHLQGIRPAGAYIGLGLGLSPKLAAIARPIEPAAKTSPSPTILQRWDRFPAANSMALLRPPRDGNSNNTYPSLASSPFLLTTQRVFAETEGYTRTLKAGMGVFSVKDHEKLDSSSNVKLYTSTMGGAGAIKNTNKMAFVDLNAMESVDDDASSPPLRTPQFLRFQDGSQSVDDNSSEELSSFQNNTCHTAWCQPNKTPSKKRSRDSTQENSTTSPRSPVFSLSVVPSEEGARFKTEIQRNGAVANTDNSYFPNSKKQEMSVCSPDHEDRCPKSDDITPVKDFLALSLSNSRFTTDFDCKQEIHEHTVQESNNIQISKAHKCSKIVRFNAMTTQHQKTMGDFETKKYSSRDAPNKKMLVAERSTHLDSESNLQHFGAHVCTAQSATISVNTHAGAERILPEDSQMNLSLDLSL